MFWCEFNCFEYIKIISFVDGDYYIVVVSEGKNRKFDIEFVVNGSVYVCFWNVSGCK